MTRNSELHARRLAATPRGVGVMCDFFAQRAENATLWDVEGRQYIDFAAGIAVLNTGHRHPRIEAAIAAQLQQFTHTAYQVVPYESVVVLAERLNKLVPISGPVKTAFFTTGAEALENAVKIARAHTGRAGIVTFGGGFHGRTLMTLAMTGKVAPYKLGFGPFPADVFHVPFPSAIENVSAADSLAALAQLFKTDIDPLRVAAIVIEPVQGEGGFNPAPTELMQGLRALCDQYGIVFIADEVQTGFARTGKLFSMEHHGVEPDLITMAKSLAGGMPLSAVAGRACIMDAPAPGGIGGTYAGNPLAVASALAVLDVIEDEMLCDRSAALGAKLVARLLAAKESNKAIADVRAQGSMVAVELRDPASGAHDADAVKRVQAEALEQGLLLLSCGMSGNVIRFLYPLTISDALFDRALDIIDGALKA
ncbi:4-aminobutyrate aminotransferase [Variovorax boronicumulans]|uniref:4-aminobutyrate aminotransferase n=1 Tax=Variovorax boronicumulans TaxID=436515 RepID=A0AAW8CY99_9BURK|nr:4-aminobutyrate--2-oxoglutarate transaminase [Variovorax boronicumulans]MDP9896368.1 4-aminobutyrate aminotransferase [Variovorax boronicumulans]MDP9995717.1 4-aminobutyrate aminotransferase [Variovorax boronicumulans]MDQ0006818.1 4-aminobutyrate aminotransferase [Variovorax boronicumulans]MDQ0036765.1 4-aminobutyrate aminotransferase [Variovorax boronicumulans]MDQ0056321.1 4-aminobutyrate aminotransferase [Variovorax boronicumulans]